MVFSKDDLELCKLISGFFLKSAELICSIATTGTRQNSTHATNGRTDENCPCNPQGSEFLAKWAHYRGTSPLPPLVIEVFLDIKDLSSTHIVQLEDVDHNLWYVCNGQRKDSIMLARWLVELDADSPAFKSYGDVDTSSVSTSTTSEQIVLLLRYLRTVIELLPIQDLATSTLGGTVDKTTGVRVRPKIGVKMLDGRQPIPSKGRVGLNKPIINTYNNSTTNKSNVPPHLEQLMLTSVWTKFGLLRISVSYRRDCTFIITDTSSSLSSNNKPFTLTGDNRVTAERPLDTSYSFLDISPADGLVPSVEAGRVPISLPSRPGIIHMRNPRFQNTGSANERSVDKFSQGGSLPRGNVPNIQMNKLRSQPSSFGTEKSISHGMYQHEHHSDTCNCSGKPSMGSWHIHTNQSPYGKPDSVTVSQKHNHDRVSFGRKKSPKFPLQNKETTTDLLEFVKSLDERPELGIKKRLHAGTEFYADSTSKNLGWRPLNETFNKNGQGTLLGQPEENSVQPEIVGDSHCKRLIAKSGTDRSSSRSPQALLPQPLLFHRSIQEQLSSGSIGRLNGFWDRKENQPSLGHSRDKLSLRGSISMDSLKSALGNEFAYCKGRHRIYDELLAERSVFGEGFDYVNYGARSLVENSALASGVRHGSHIAVNRGIQLTSDTLSSNSHLTVTRDEAQAKFYREVDISTKDLLSEIEQRDLDASSS